MKINLILKLIVLLAVYNKCIYQDSVRSNCINNDTLKLCNKNPIYLEHISKKISLAEFSDTDFTQSNRTIEIADDYVKIDYFNNNLLFYTMKIFSSDRIIEDKKSVDIDTSILALPRINIYEESKDAIWFSLKFTNYPATHISYDFLNAEISEITINYFTNSVVIKNSNIKDHVLKMNVKFMDLNEETKILKKIDLEIPIKYSE